MFCKEGTHEANVYGKDRMFRKSKSNTIRAGAVDAPPHPQHGVSPEKSVVPKLSKSPHSDAHLQTRSLALGCSVARTPGIWEGSSPGRAVTRDTGGGLRADAPRQHCRSQVSPSAEVPCGPAVGGRGPPACSQTHGALPDARLSVFLSCDPIY